jgi:hypothetical protein
MSARLAKPQPRLRAIDRYVPPKTTKRRHTSHREEVVELTVKLFSSLVLCLGGAYASISLFPYHLTQQARLAEVSTEVKETQQRVDRLYQDFNNNFDPQQTKTLMQRYSQKIAQDRRPIMWLESKPKP